MFCAFVLMQSYPIKNDFFYAREDKEEREMRRIKEIGRGKRLISTILTISVMLAGIPGAGTLAAGGKPIERGNVRKHLKNGIAMVPRNRKERGILNDLSVYDNLSMGFFNTRMKALLIRIKEEKARYLRMQASLFIKSDHPKDRITSLSGGNQQKVILGRWLETNADVLIFDNPTQGIDVGTKFEIYHLLIELAKAGKAVVVFSCEFPEISKVADRCIVMYMGEVNAVLDREDIAEAKLMYYSTGANVEGMKDAQNGARH